MNINYVVVVIPMYKVELDWDEKISLKRVFEVLGKHNIVICCPDALDLTHIENSYGIQHIERFPNFFFNDIAGYNRLMMSVSFYERFRDYKYMLIYQLDAFVFTDRLLHFCNQGYDYIGAPWTQPYGICKFKGDTYHFKVGNGGFSLRNVEACIDVLKKFKDVVSEWEENEDSFFAYCGHFYPQNFSVAPFKIARKFSFEASVRRLYKKNAYELPFGCHAWTKFGGDIYPDLFKRAGVNIDVFKNMLGYQDLKHETIRFKCRFDSKIFRFKTFSEIFPYRSCWSIVGFGKVGKELLEFFLNIGVKVTTIYDSRFARMHEVKDNIRFLNFNDTVQLEKDKGHIIVSSYKYEQEIILKLESMGWLYGRDYISFGREYARRFSGIGYEKYLYSEENSMLWRK